MPRVTIELSPQTHRVLQETAALQGRSVDAVIVESLEHWEVRLIEPARKIVAEAGTPDLSDEDAMAIAVRETRLHREGR